MSELTMAAVEGTVPETVRSIEIITEEILFYKRQAGSAIIEIGRRLNEAKEQLGHGEWLPWLQEKVDFSERSAQNFMRLAREYEKSAEIADLGASKALALLALPVSEREEFVAEKHEVNGEEKSVAEMTAAELKQAIAERDEARRALEEERQASEGSALLLAEMQEKMERARSEQLVAESAREKMTEDMKLLNERLAGLNDEVAEKERELAELRSRPVDVAVQYQTDPAELAAAKKEAAADAEQKMKAKIEKAEKALARAKEEKEKAEAEQKRLQADLDTARTEITAITEDAERLRKEAQMAGNKEIAAFMIYFETGQEMADKMTGILQKMDRSGQKETADKLRKALAAFADQLTEAAEAKGAE